MAGRDVNCILYDVDRVRVLSHDTGCVSFAALECRLSCEERVAGSGGSSVAA